VLRGETVVDGEHRCPGAFRKPAADPVVGFQAANRPAAAVQVNDKRRAAGDGAVQPRRYLADPQLADRVHLRPARALPGPLIGSLPHRRHVARGERRHLSHESGQLLVSEWSQHAAMLPPRPSREPLPEGRPCT
jgi:hypothetical protein